MKKEGVCAQTPANGIIDIGIDGYDPTGLYCGGSWAYRRIAQVIMSDFENPKEAWKFATMLASAMNRHASKIHEMIREA